MCTSGVDGHHLTLSMRPILLSISKMNKQNFQSFTFFPVAPLLRNLLQDMMSFLSICTSVSVGMNKCSLVREKTLDLKTSVLSVCTKVGGGG